jgi:hypothetical protein
MNIVIGMYPGYSGGKFLFNCLGLSDQAYLQHIDLVRQQLAGQLTPQDKFNLLINKLNSVGDEWNDLGLGCCQLFGKGSAPQHNPAEFYPEIKLLAAGDKLFFVVAHTLEHFKIVTALWPSATIVLFDKCNKFLTWRYKGIQKKPSFDPAILEYAKQYNPIVWHADTYLDSQDFFTSLEKLYAQLGLGDFNLELIKPFYEKYMLTLGKIKT